MRKIICFIILLTSVGKMMGQELYVFSEPASNMPAKSLGLKMTAMYGKGVH